jgi:hypothetical protein
VCCRGSFYRYCFDLLAKWNCLGGPVFGVPVMPPVEIKQPHSSLHCFLLLRSLYNIILAYVYIYLFVNNHWMIGWLWTVNWRGYEMVMAEYKGTILAVVWRDWKKLFKLAVMIVLQTKLNWVPASWSSLLNLWCYMMKYYLIYRGNICMFGLQEYSRRDAGCE